MVASLALLMGAGTTIRLCKKLLAADALAAALIPFHHGYLRADRYYLSVPPVAEAWELRVLTALAVSLGVLVVTALVRAWAIRPVQQGYSRWFWVPAGLTMALGLVHGTCVAPVLSVLDTTQRQIKIQIWQGWSMSERRIPFDQVQRLTAYHQPVYVNGDWHKKLMLAAILPDSDTLVLGHSTIAYGGQRAAVATVTAADHQQATQLLAWCRQAGLP